MRPERGMGRQTDSDDAPNVLVVAKLLVECLGCGHRRRAEPRHPGDCPKCGYVGWARSSELSETSRRALRERPLPTRVLRAL